MRRHYNQYGEDDYDDFMENPHEYWFTAKLGTVVEYKEWNDKWGRLDIGRYGMVVEEEASNGGSKIQFVGVNVQGRPAAGIATMKKADVKVVKNSNIIDEVREQASRIRGREIETYDTFRNKQKKTIQEQVKLVIFEHPGAGGRIQFYVWVKPTKGKKFVTRGSAKTKRQIEDLLDQIGDLPGVSSVEIRMD